MRMLTNRQALLTRQSYGKEVTPEREVVWQYDAPEAADIHTGPPIRLDKVMIVRNGLPPKLTIIEKNLEPWKWRTRCRPRARPVPRGCIRKSGAGG
jgi:hypothetical protein